MFAALLNKRRYRYEVERDYLYEFTGCQSYPAEIRDGVLAVPKIAAEWDTAILAIDLRPTRFRGYCAPQLRISGGGCSHIQTFEHGASGKRFVDVSAMVVDGGSLRFAGKHLLLPDQVGELRLFTNPSISGAKILAVSPHPDDAEIAAFGLYSDGDRDKTYVVTVTAGDNGEKIYGDFLEERKEHYLKKGELRVWNSITVPLLGNVAPEHAVNLGYFDSRLQTMFDQKDQPVQSRYTESFDIGRYRRMNYPNNLVKADALPTWDSLVADFCHILKTIEPDIIVAPYPAMNSHSDHSLATEAVFEAIRRNGLCKGKLFLYAIDDSRTGGGLYPFGGLHELIALPPNFRNSLAPSGIYTHQLNTSKQRDKFFALEAMNDIRIDYAFGTLNINGKVKTLKKIAVKAFRAVVKNIFDIDRGYLRRVVKANELFFVFNVADIHDDAVKKRISA